MLRCEHSLYRVFGFVTSQRLQSSPETKSKAMPTKAECQLANSSYHTFIETFFFLRMFIDTFSIYGSFELYILSVWVFTKLYKW